MSQPSDPPTPENTENNDNNAGAGASAAAEQPERNTIVRRMIGLFLGPLLGLAAFLAMPEIPLPIEGDDGSMMPSDELSANASVVAAIAVVMAVWWMTEALPLPATALLPLAIFPIVLEDTSIDDVTAPYANEIIFLFMGGFVIALAMQRWNLHKRVALAIVAAVGTGPVSIIGGFMLATAFITMWVSNTATAMMMMPIGLAVIGLVTQLRDGRTDANFATALMLGIAYSASIGSVATLIGTPPNAFMAGYLAQEHDISLGFGQWMLVGAPLAAVFLVVCWVVLTKFVYRPETKDLGEARSHIRQELRGLGPMSRGEWTVLAVFVCTALAWIFIPLLAETEGIGGALPWLANFTDGGIAIAAAVILFILPVDGRRGVRAIDWDQAVKLPWGVLLLFGGGLSLSAQFGSSGLSLWVGERVEALGGIPGWVFILLVTAIVLILTELTSNTATASIFIPVMAGVAVGLGLPVLTLVVPAALAASLAFMLPVATPPNAIVFGTGYVRIGQMVKAGLWLNLIALFLVLGTMYTAVYWVFGL
ncbi:DASS family sodium-coupled anion symporter [Nocardiopsis sp. HNM0947]|uniref:Sodium-dependent dicarboxylate transporter SdcS n=1 Tax=Nocardiopsis coralli TaxID=2772213 RepID=A0ABR9P4R2_9ACTN|nr:DASS family sodium-coupled anion symporter [Nocardiopsis coralli]MBE2998833.1 DASS family sodium-coupled anion symporter [Nocardiopsis coralli]